MARYKRIHIENRINYACSVIGAKSAEYRAGSVVNGHSHMAVFYCHNEQFVVRAKTAPILMEKLDAFINGAFAAKS